MTQQRSGTTRRHRRRYTETTDFIAFTARMIRRCGERVSVADMGELEALLALRAAVDDAIATAVPGVRDNGGYTWTSIGAAAGITRQAAQQKWGPRAQARRARAAIRYALAA